MNIDKIVENLKNYISFSEKECNFPSIYDWNWNMDLANDIETLLTAYEKEKEKNKELSNSYDKLAKECNEENKRCMLLAVENQDLKEKNKKIEIIVNKLMPLAECSYWNYEKHTCTHTCRGCDDLNEYNKRTSSGILIDKDRYCRLYEDGNAEKDTKFVDVEDLIKRHLKEE